MPQGGPRAEDSALIERARNGDHEAYAALVRDHQDMAFRTAFLITRSSSDAEDVVQEAFLKAYRSLARFRPGASFRPWILRIVANEARNRRRSAVRRPEMIWGDPGPGVLIDAPEPVDPGASPEEQALASEQRGYLLAALDRLDESDRLMIVYRYLFQLNEAEMSEALDVPRGTVKSRLSRAMARLRQRFPAED